LEPTERAHASGLGTLSLAALGVVYGDIGTSPLYAVRESLEGHGHVIDVTEANVLGLLSLIFWSLVVVISIKYLLFVMRADNQGEGGILALTALVTPDGHLRTPTRFALISVGLFGTALLYGDGMITPAISVLSAVEGTRVATESLDRFVIPISCVILVGLFAVQRRGTASIGKVFGPVMVVWFGTLAALGLIHIVDEPSVFRAIDPRYGMDFFLENGFDGFLALGSVFLVVTGGEALYADMGHFGTRPIKLGWFALVLPALVLNYFGQGALLLGEPDAIESPFYRLVPESFVLPLVVLATMATIIASQALISGAFSLTMQAVQLGYAPRFRIVHTSDRAIGQIYIPAVNWVLMLACLGLVLGFRSSTNLAAAYGVAVTMTMVITTLLFAVVARERFGWSKAAVGAAAVVFLAIDLAFFGANIFKIPAGGWFPLVVGAIVMTLLTTWRTGRRIVSERISRADGRLRPAEPLPSHHGEQQGGSAAPGSRSTTSSEDWTRRRSGCRAPPSTCSPCPGRPRRRSSPTTATTTCCTSASWCCRSSRPSGPACLRRNGPKSPSTGTGSPASSCATGSWRSPTCPSGSPRALPPSSASTRRRWTSSSDPSS
jgi:KUP system potassium uptake protein